MKLSGRVRSAIFGVAAATGAWWMAPAQAAYVIRFEESGGDVLANGSGSLDLSDLTFDRSAEFRRAQVSGDIAAVIVGTAFGPDPISVFTGFSGPSSFGPGPSTFADDGAGKKLGIATSDSAPGDILGVPSDYLSGSPLTASSIWSGQTFASLGLDPGVYIYSWGTGDHADTFTVQIGVPEPSTWATMLVGFVGLGLAGYRRARGPRAA
jgi:hypothetical protein